MGVLASLLVNLSLNSAAFAYGAGKVRSELGGLTEAAEATHEALLHVAEVAGISASVEGLKSMVESAIEAGGAITRLSENLRIPVEQLSALQGLAFTEGNVSADQFTTLLDKMAKNLGTAASQGGSFAKQLAQVGLDAKVLAAQGLDKSFLQIADTIQRLPTPAAQAAFAVETFGKQGMALLPMLREGSAGLEEFKKQMEGTGAITTALDAQKLAEAEESLNKLKLTAAGLAKELAVASIPLIDAITSGAHSAIPATESLLSQNAELLGGIAAGIAVYKARNILWETGAGLLKGLNSISLLAAGSEAEATAATQAHEAAQRQLMTSVLALTAAKRELAAASEMAANGEWAESAATGALIKMKLAETQVEADSATVTIFAAEAKNAAAGAAAATTAWAGATAALGTAISAAIPLAAIATIGLFTAAVYKAAEEDKSWSQSCYEVVRGIGLIGNAVDELQDKLEKLGELQTELANIKLGLNAPGADQAKGHQAELDNLNQQLVIAKKAAEDEAKANEQIAWQNANRPVDEFGRQMGDPESLVTGAQAKIDSLNKQIETAKALLDADKSAAKSAEEHANVLTRAKAKIDEDALHIKRTLAGLKESIDTFGMSASDKKVWELEQNPAAKSQDIETARNYSDQLKQLDAVEKLNQAYSEGVKTLQEHGEQLGEAQSALLKMKETAAGYEALVSKGATPELVSGWNKAVEAVKLLQDAVKKDTDTEKLKKAGENAKSMWEAAMTPLQKYQDQLAKLEDAAVFKDSFGNSVKLLSDEQKKQIADGLKADMDKANEREEGHKKAADHVAPNTAGQQRRFDLYVPASAQSHGHGIKDVVRHTERTAKACENTDHNIDRVQRDVQDLKQAGQAFAVVSLNSL